MELKEYDVVYTLKGTDDVNNGTVSASDLEDAKTEALDKYGGVGIIRNVTEVSDDTISYIETSKEQQIIEILER